jgi:hypothetical protein
LIRAVRKERIASQTDGDIKRAINFIKNAHKYRGDKRYGSVCENGCMPHAKLLKLMAMPSKQFTELMLTANEAGIISKTPGIEFNYAGDVYKVLDAD